MCSILFRDTKFSTCPATSLIVHVSIIPVTEEVNFALRVRRTRQRADHGECSEGAGQPLSAHDGSGVGGRQNPCQPKQTALKNCPECWEGHTKEDVKEFV